MTRSLVYVATPYSKYPKGIEAAFRDACKVTAALIEDGINAYSPIAHTHPVAIYGKIDPLDHGIWMKFDAAMMEAATELLVIEMPGWKESKGIAIEVETFRKAGKPITYLTWPALKFDRTQIPSGPMGQTLKMAEST